MKRVKKLSMGFVCLIICACLAACGETKSESTAIVLPLEPIKEEISELPTDENANNNKADKNGNKNAEDIISQEDGNKNAEDIISPEVGENSVEKTGNLEENTESEITESIKGYIELVENNGFSISKYLTFQSENGADIAVVTTVEADKQIIKVSYTDSTKFIVCTSTDGTTGKYTDGSADDLKTKKAVDLEGIYSGEEFIAQKITIYNFK